MLGEGFESGVIFGGDEATGGVFVEAMNDAGAGRVGFVGELSLAVVEEGIDEGAIGVAGGGMDDHAGGFVDDDEVWVFEEDFEGDVLGEDFGG